MLGWPGWAESGRDVGGLACGIGGAMFPGGWWRWLSYEDAQGRELRIGPVFRTVLDGRRKMIGSVWVQRYLSQVQVTIELTIANRLRARQLQ